MRGIRLGELQGEAMTPELAATLSLLDPEDREFFGERAGIREFDGKLSRPDAEARAFTEITAAIMRRKHDPR